MSPVDGRSRRRARVEDEIEDDHVGQSFGRSTDRVLLAVRLVHHEPRTAELTREDTAQRRVFDDERRYGRDRYQRHLPAALRGSTERNVNGG